MSSKNICAAVLSGGFSRRVGHDKALLPLGEKPLIMHAVDSARAITNQVRIVAPEIKPYKGLGVECDADRHAGIGPLAGLETALLGITSESRLLLLACDMPFVKPGVLQVLLDNWDPKVQAVVFRIDGSVLPMPGLYRRDVLFAVDRLLARKEYDINQLFKEIRTKQVGEEQMSRIDPELRTFVNLNTLDAYRRYALEAAGKPPLS